MKVNSWFLLEKSGLGGTRRRGSGSARDPSARRQVAGDGVVAGLSISVHRSVRATTPAGINHWYEYQGLIRLVTCYRVVGVLARVPPPYPLGIV